MKVLLFQKDNPLTYLDMVYQIYRKPGLEPLAYDRLCSDFGSGEVAEHVLFPVSCFFNIVDLRVDFSGKPY